MGRVICDIMYIVPTGRTTQRFKYQKLDNLSSIVIDSVLFSPQRYLFFWYHHPLLIPPFWWERWEATSFVKCSDGLAKPRNNKTRGKLATVIAGTRVSKDNPRLSINKNKLLFRFFSLFEGCVLSQASSFEGGRPLIRWFQQNTFCFRQRDHSKDADCGSQRS